MELVERLIGYGGIVIITHPQNPVKELSVDQVRKIFRGDITRWDQLGGRTENITVVRTDESQHPGTFVFMEEDFLKSKFAKDSVALTQFPGVMAKVAQTPSAIGYVRIRDAFESKPKQRDAIKILEIKKLGALVGVMPSRETVSDGSVPDQASVLFVLQQQVRREHQEICGFHCEQGLGLTGSVISEEFQTLGMHGGRWGSEINRHV